MAGGSPLHYRRFASANGIVSRQRPGVLRTDQLHTAEYHDRAIATLSDDPLGTSSPPASAVASAFLDGPAQTGHGRNAVTT